MEIARIDFPSWLEAQTLFPKFYSKCRKTGVERVALGSTQEFSKIPSFPQETVYGIVPFPSVNHSPLFFLPRIEIIQSQEKTILKKGMDLKFNEPKKLSESFSLTDQVDLPHFEQWEKSVTSVLQAIEQKKIQKIVLARRSSFKINSSPFSVLKGLLDSSLYSTVFAFQKDSSSLFLGASPEMLYQRTGRSIVTESIAGTRKRGSSLIEDIKIGAELKQSLKDNLEFSYVKDFLIESLNSLCLSYSFDPNNSIIQTSKLLHLYNRLEGILKPEIDDADILPRLHPTPAVGALPRDLGIKKIHSLESFDRNLYAGALGWISPSEASFTVTIRSAVIQEEQLHAFAGTGIVEGSDPKQEWLELNHKISHWRHLLCPLTL